MDRINYLQLSALHISDMRHLEKNDRDTWSYFMEGKFFCQKNDIPHEDIGQDYGKGKNGAMGVWSIKQLKHLEPLVHDSSNSVVNVPGNGEAWKKTEFWFKILSSVWKCLNAEAKSMSAIIIECIVTGQVFSDATYENFIGTYNAGEGLYQVFVDEWLKPDSKVGVFAQLRKAVIKKWKSRNKGIKIK